MPVSAICPILDKGGLQCRRLFGGSLRPFLGHSADRWCHFTTGGDMGVLSACYDTLPTWNLFFDSALLQIIQPKQKLNKWLCHACL